MIRNWLCLDVAVHGRYHPTAWTYLLRRGIEPVFAEGDQAALAAARPDFIAFNYYFSHTVAAPTGGAEDVGHTGDAGLSVGEAGVYRAVRNPHLKTNTFGWEIDPVGFRVTLRETDDRYRLPLLVTENGLGAFDVLEDCAVHVAARPHRARDRRACGSPATPPGERSRKEPFMTRSLSGRLPPRPHPAASPCGANQSSMRTPGTLKADAEEFDDPCQAVPHGVAVDVEGRGGAIPADLDKLRRLVADLRRSPAMVLRNHHPLTGGDAGPDLQDDTAYDLARRQLG
ncbi:family 1 glycosylhydrolase [Streptomyces sp. NPDC047081]|uniref:family 1 glycosylhydrolase n=1 Tax=Streptomyces sp. NPDC047081 TaxID=3154706 RepID=UPI0033FCE530